MRFATYESDGRERYGLVLRHPREGADWIFDPVEVESAARTLPALKGAGYTWWRPDFAGPDGRPKTLTEHLALGPPGMDRMRRMQDFLLRYLEQGDPLVFGRAGAPLARVALQAPIPEPRLLLGAVGNNAGFLRMDTTRGRNLDHPKCHQRTLTSIVGPGQPIVLPPGCTQWAGTTELGVVIGRGGRQIARDRAREHIAGYTVINDGLGNLYANRWRELDDKAGLSRSHFHSANSASWLDKKADTMLAMGPWLVTPEEVGDPYDLMAFYRENGLSRNRAHSGALCCGIEEMIHWLSQFLTLEAGMVLHLGAMGQDGLAAGAAERFGPDYFVECEIERVGALRNPLVAMTHDWRHDEDPGRKVHPSPMVRKLIREKRSAIARTEDWKVGHARHFWTVLGNSQAAQAEDGVEPRPYPLAYNAPAASLSASGGSLALPPGAGTVTATCELGVVIKSLARQLSPEDAAKHILGYVVLAVLRDASFRDRLIEPHVLQAGMPAICSRWPEGFNVCSEPPVPLETCRGRAMRLTIAGVGETQASTDAYVLEPASIIAELSRGITLLPGDVITLGRAGSGVVLPANLPLPTGTLVRAAIAGVGEAWAELNDQRRSSGHR